MAAPAAAAGSSPGSCPSYAVICSFLERYGALLDLPELTFSQLERYLLDTSAVPKLLVDLHVKLLRKIGKSVSADRWEKYLVKVCQEFNNTWAWELEKKGYKELTVECKTGILKYLCECQFDDNVKFKTAINEEDPDKMRLQPIGKDKDGLMYWFQLDQDNNVRLYVEEQDDLDGSSWKCIVRERNDLAEIVALLKTQIDPALLTKKDQEEGPSPEDGENKKGEEGGVKKEEDTSEDEHNKPSKDTVCSVSAELESKEEAAQKEDSKLNVLDAKSPSNGIKDNQTDSASTIQSEMPMVDDKVTINKQNIKEEPMEVSESKEATATSATEHSTEKQCGALLTEQAEEARRKTAEELQRAMKNDQQAKIPLKKREMKLSEDFDNTSGSSSIIVRNPSVAPVKEAPKVEEINKEVPVASVGVVKEPKSDHVNGDTQPATETTFNNGLRESQKEMGAQGDSAGGKEQQTKAIAGEGSIAVEVVAKETTNLPLDKKVIKDIDEEKKVASNTEESKEVTMPDEITPQKNIPAMKAEKESTDIPEEVKTTALKVAKAPATLMAEALPLCKEAASPSDKSTDRKEEDKCSVSKDINVTVAPVDDNTFTSKETCKIASPDNSQKLDGVQGTDSPVVSKEVKLDAPEETKTIVVPKDTDTSVAKEMEKPAITKVTEKQSDSKNTEITVITKETGRLNPITEKPDDKLTESPVIVKKTEKPSSNKVGTENVDGPKKTEKPSSNKVGTENVDGPKKTDTLVIKKTDTLVIKKTDTLVIKKTEVPEQKNDSENLGNLQETKTSSVIKKADKPSSNKDTEKLDSTKETDKSSVIKKMEKKGASKLIEKCGGPEDTMVSSIIKEKPAVTAAGTKVITEEKEKTVLEKDSEKSVSCKDTEKTAVAEMNEKKSVPKDVEKVAVTEKLTHPQLDESKKVKKLATAKDTETVTKQMEKSFCPKGEKSDTTKETKKPSDTKSNDTKEVVKLAINDDAKQLPSPKNGKGDQEEPMETSLEKSTDKSIKTQAADQESTKVVKGGEKSESEPDKEKQNTSKEKLEHTNHLPTETDGEKDKEIKGDTTIEKMEDAKEYKQAEKGDDAKVSQGSAEDKPNDEREKRDAETTGTEAAGGGEVSSEIQEEGIRLKIRIPTHRRKSDLRREERRGDSESDTGEGRSLRRSPRICRPTSKGVEFHDRRIEKKQATPPVEKGEREENEEEEEEEEKAVQKKPREKKVDQEGQPKSKGKRRRRTRWSNTRTRSRKKKGSGEDDDDDDESSEDESEEDDSDEDFKVERGKNRRRNRNRERRSSDSSTSSDDLPPNDDPCKHCGLPNHPELILLCDSCDNGYHTACLRPPLMIIPDGEWYCPPCQHKLLCDKLEEQLLNLDAALKKKERAERRKERLVYVGISLENIIDPSVELDEEKQEEEEEEEVVVKKEKKEVKKSKSWGRRSTRTKKCISYRFDEFDEAIEEAIEEDIKEAEGGGAGRGKDMANITGHRGKDMSVIMQAEEGKENGGPPRPSAGQRRKKRRRLNDLDSDSTMEEEESEDEFRISDSSEDEFVLSENDAESGAGSNKDSDFGSSGDGPRRRTARSKRPSKRRRSTRQPRKRRRPRGYSDDEEEETDEEDEEEIATEGSSEYSDSDLDMSRRRSRRRQKKQVNYCETSESEGSKAGTNRDKVKPRRRFASSDSEASPTKDSNDEEKERTVKRRADSSEEESKQRRRRISLKRRRASEEDDDSDSDESEEEERPVRKRVNRIDSDDDDEEEEKEKEKEKEEEKEKKVVAEKEDEEGGVLGKGTSPLDYNLVELPPTNGQNPIKGLEGLAVGAPGLMTQLGPKNISATPAVAIAPNGLVSQEMAPQDDDEDDLLGVTDLVDYVCNSEQL